MTNEYSNCKVAIDDKGFLTATIDLNKPHGLSSTGKSITLGTSNGNQKIVWKDRILNCGINVYVKNPKYVQTAEDKAKMEEIYASK